MACRGKSPSSPGGAPAPACASSCGVPSTAITRSGMAPAASAATTTAAARCRPPDGPSFPEPVISRCQTVAVRSRTSSSRVERHKICPSGEDPTVRVGVPKEIKTFENRVGLVPGSARELTHHGHDVLVETGAGAGSGFTDDAYRAAGARVAKNAEEVFAQTELIVKVKEPQPIETARLRPGQVLFTYLHLAANRPQAEGLMRSGSTAIAYETVTDARGGLPLLAPMSEVAGRMAVHVGAHYLEKGQGGQGILLAGVPGVPAAKVVILGDIPIDPGGCFATSRPTTLAEPSYSEEGIIHYCVTNMPSAVARTSTLALNNATLPFVLALADKGWRQALAADAHLRPGLNVHAGRIIHPAVARDLNVEPGPAPV